MRESQYSFFFISFIFLLFDTFHNNNTPFLRVYAKTNTDAEVHEPIYISSNNEEDEVRRGRSGGDDLMSLSSESSSSYDHLMSRRITESDPHFQEKFPSPNSNYNRIMGFILAYNYDHIDPLLLIFNEYVSICESGWNVTIVLFTTSPWSNRMRKLIDMKNYCYRIGRAYTIRYSIHDPSISISLGIYYKHTYTITYTLHHFI